MEGVTERIWSSDGGHRVPVLRAALGINSSHKGITRGTHLHFTLTTLSGNDWRLLLSAPSPFISDMPLIFYAAIMENWTSTALSNFPRLWDVKSMRPFHGVKMTELSIILL